MLNPMVGDLKLISVVSKYAVQMRLAISLEINGSINKIQKKGGGAALLFGTQDLFAQANWQTPTDFSSILSWLKRLNGIATRHYSHFFQRIK